MEHGRLIVGAGIIAALLIGAGSAVKGDTQKLPWRLLNIGFATAILAAVDAAGLGAIAAPLAVLLAGTIGLMQAPTLLTAIKQIGG